MTVWCAGLDETADCGQRIEINIQEKELCVKFGYLQRSYRDAQSTGHKTQTAVNFAAILQLHIIESSGVLEGFYVARIAFFRGG
jgi:hypothetical protein